MKTYEADDYCDCEAFDLWVFRRDNPNVPEQEGEMPDQDEVICVKAKGLEKQVKCDEVMMMGDSEFTYYPHFIVKEYK
jgi:hypothetical protein